MQCMGAFAQLRIFFRTLDITLALIKHAQLKPLSDGKAEGHENRREEGRRALHGGQLQAALRRRLEGRAQVRVAKPLN